MGTAVGATAAADQLIWNVLNPLEPCAAACPDTIIEISKNANEASTPRCGAVVVGVIGSIVHDFIAGRG